jgi:peroxiredoxin
MLKSLVGALNVQSTVPGALLAVLILSLTCSMSMKYGHADVPIAETATTTKPLQVGQSAPRFTLQTVDNETFVFDPLSLERPVIAITFRGGWCPYCNMHLSELKDVVAEIDALGVDILFLSGDRPDLLYKSLSREAQSDIAALDYQILSDADGRPSRSASHSRRHSGRSTGATKRARTSSIHRCCAMACCQSRQSSQLTGTAQSHSPIRTPTTKFAYRLRNCCKWRLRSLHPNSRQLSLMVRFSDS